MEYVHACGFCGWSRAAATPVMLQPSCPDCGCSLDSNTSEALLQAQPEPAAAMPRMHPLVVTLVMLFSLGTLVLATRYGIAHGGVPAAMIDGGGTGFLLLAFLPERYAPGRSRG